MILVILSKIKNTIAPIMAKEAIELYLESLYENKEEIHENNKDNNENNEDNE